jgi:PAS domain S-box-containing protein
MADTLRVLYVDDESDLLNIGKLFLEESGDFTVTTTLSAPEGIRLLEQEKFDAIISDYQMPGMDGIQFLVEVRTRFGPVPFILFTGKGREEVVIQAINSGVNFYLQKGGNPSAQFAELVHKVRQATSQKRAEDALRESEGRYKNISETTTDFVFSCIKYEAGTYSIDWIAGASERITGYTIDDLLAMGCWRCLVHPDDTSVFDENITNLLEGTSSTCILRIRTKSGTERWLAVNTTHVPTKDPSSFSHVFGGCRDITERKKAEEALQRQSVALTILNEIISTANKADNLPHLLENILAESLRLLDFDAGGIYLVDRFTRTANVVKSKNLTPEFLAEIQTVPIDKKPYDTLFIQNEPIITQNYAQISPAHLKTFGFQSIASIPLLSKGVAIGALNLASTRKHVISDEEKQTLISISMELGSTIERMSAEEEIKKVKENLEILFNSIDEMVFVLDMQGGILAVNETVEKRLSYTQRELTGTNVLLLHVPERRDEALRIVQGMIAGTIDSCPVPVLAKDGTRIEVETRVTRGWWNGSEVLIGVSRDITERKRVEEALRESEVFNRNLVENLPDYIVVYGSDGKILYVNPASAKALGYDADKLVGTSLLLYISEEYRDEVISRTSERRKGGEVSPYEINLISSDGRQRSVIVKGTPIQYHGNFAVLLLLIDITERKGVEEALNSANRKLTLLSSITRHDINNQLTVQMGYLSLLEMKQIDPTQNEYFQKVSTAAQRISAMVQFTEEYEEIGAHAPAWQECRTLVDTAAKQAPLGKVLVKNDLIAGAEVFADPLIGKVFYNLMDNAARYGGKITTIRLSMQESGDDHLIVCEDDGDGVVTKEKEKIFERGFGKNTGLGLALSREILDITGITIRETGEIGKGARFEIAVPKGAWRIGGTGV